MRHVLLHRPLSDNKSRRSALTLVELIAVLVAVGVLAFVVFINVGLRSPPCRELSTRLVCAANIKGIGTAMKIYANDNAGSWAIPAFDESAFGLIDYTVRPGSGEGSVRSPNREQPSISGPGGARQVSNTRAFWMLVRSGDITVQQFICPNSGETPDPTPSLDLYYDFTGYGHISYGYHMPFGPPETRPREGCDNRMIIAADKGPYVDATVATPPPGLAVPLGSTLRKSTSSAPWAPFNSRNHQGEGQNVLFADGHVSFLRTPIVGVDNDNIYTIALDGTTPACRTAGESPWMRSAHPFVTVDPDTGERTSTDSVIFP